MSSARISDVGDRRPSLDSLYRRFAAIDLAYLSARCSVADCAAIHRAIWTKFGAVRQRPVSRSTLRQFLIAQAAARCGDRPMHRNMETAEFLQRALSEMSPAVARLVQWRLANRSYSELAPLWNTKAEKLFRVFAVFRRRLMRINDQIHWALAIPDDPAQTPGWLERHLVGGRLGLLVAELETVHPDSSSDRAFLLPLLRGHRLAGVLESGLAVLSARRIAALLTHPRLLLDLQAIVLAQGGPYWDEVRPIDDRLAILAERHWPSIRAA